MHLILLLIYCLFTTLGAAPCPDHIEPEVWEKVSPYLLPENHPLKAKLDQLFKVAGKRLIESQTTLEAAGFCHREKGNTSGIIVMSHRNLKNWLIKVYTEEQAMPAWEKYVERCQGAEATRQAIKKYKFERYFAVPKKYIYVLQAEPEPKEGAFKKDFILVAENMNIHRLSKNKKKWLQESHNKKLLKAFWIILTDVGLSDCWLINNAAWGANRKVNFIDTERFNIWPVKYSRFLPFLTPSGQEYWNSLKLKKKK